MNGLASCKASRWHEVPSANSVPDSGPARHLQNKKLAVTKDRRRRESGSVLWQSVTPCIFSKKASFFKAPVWSTRQDIRKNIEAVLPSLDSYVQCVAELEQKVRRGELSLECYKDVKTAEALNVGSAYAIEAPANLVDSNLGGMSFWVKEVLSAINPFAVADLRGLSPDENGRINKSDWSLTYNGVRLFALASGPLYDNSHSRFSGGREQKHVMLHLQPSIMFKLNYAAFRLTSDRAKELNQKRFAAAGKGYTNPKQSHGTLHEAAKVILPLSPDDPHVCWWK